MTSYKDSGVDVDLGNEASKIFYEASKKTWENRKGKFGEVVSSQNSFSSLRFFDAPSEGSKIKMSLSSDGIGTKVEVSQRVKDYSTIAFDLIAMVVDDAVVRGGVPITVSTVLDVNSLNKDENAIEYMEQLANGFVKACYDAGITVSNGEIAELGDSVSGYGDFNYSWSSTLLWATTEDKLIDGSKIEENASIVMLREKGFRSNGISLLRKVLLENYGDNWHEKEIEGINLGRESLTPSKIYSKFLVHLLGDINELPKVNIQAVSHITGGGIPEKLGRVLEPTNFGFELDNLFEPNPLMLKCQELGNIKDEEVYKTWNMGQGMAIITNEPEKVIEFAKEFNIEAKVSGKVSSEKKFKLKSEGHFKKEEFIEF